MADTLTTSGDLKPQALQILETLLASQFGALFENKAPTLAQIVKLGASTVEKYVGQGHKLSSQEKLAVAKKLVPLAIDLYVKTGKITVERAAELKKQVAEDVDAVENIVTVIIETANDPTDLVNKIGTVASNPEFQAAVQHVGRRTSKCSPCW